MTTRRRQQRRDGVSPPLGPVRPTLTIEQIRQLAADLIRELAPVAGDADAVRKVLLRWLDNEDNGRLSMVCMSAVQIMFTDCLTRTPIGAWTLDPPPPERTP